MGPWSHTGHKLREQLQPTTSDFIVHAMPHEKTMAHGAANHIAYYPIGYMHSRVLFDEQDALLSEFHWL